MSPLSSSSHQPGEILALEITALNDRGEGVGQQQGRVVFVPNAVPGDHLLVRLTQVKRNFSIATLHQIQVPAPGRIRPACIVADKCGGCQWQQVDYTLQLEAKTQQVKDALQRIGKLTPPPADPILAAPDGLCYRNKVTYPIDGRSGRIRVGYYEVNSHRLVNLTQCPVQDERLDPYLAQIKQDLQEAGWPAYDETTHRGSLRHLSLRIGRRTGEVLLTLVSRDLDLPKLEVWAKRWLKRHPDLVGVCLNRNPARTNTIFGSETHLVAGRPTLREEFGGLSLWIDSTSFFQVYTEQAERFFGWILDQLALNGSETAIDAYCGIGTFSLLLAQRAHHVTGIESWPEAVAQARHNARYSHLNNITFRQGTVEAILPELDPAEIVILDPPRRGCEAEVLAALLRHRPKRIAYISCHPATLARDLQILLADPIYRFSHWRAADFFPQTAHVESVAFLER